MLYWRLGKKADLDLTTCFQAFCIQSTLYALNRSGVNFQSSKPSTEHIILALKTQKPISFRLCCYYQPSMFPQIPLVVQHTKASAGAVFNSVQNQPRQQSPRVKAQGDTGKTVPSMLEAIIIGAVCHFFLIN